MSFLSDGWLRLQATLAHRRACRQVARESIGRLAERIGSAPVGASGRAVDDVVRAHARAVHGRLGPRDSACLERAFGLTILLRRHGHAATLVVGIRPDRPGGAIEEGHAWVELDGRPVAEPDGKTENYLEFLRAPSISPEDRS